MRRKISWTDGRTDRRKEVKQYIWSRTSYRYPISWEAFLDPSDCYFLFADFVDFYTHWTYMLNFRRIFLSNYWWQKSDIWSQASYRYPISWEVFLDPSDCYFLFADFLDFYTHWTYIMYMPIFSRIFLSCNNVAPVTNLCLGRATTRSHSSQWSKKKFAVET